MTCGFESIKVQSVATTKHAFQIEASEEGGQLGKVFLHAAKLRGTNICMPCTNRLFNATFSSINQMVKIGEKGRGTKFFKGRGGRGGGPLISAGKSGTKCFKEGSIFFSENIGLPGPFFF